MNRLPVRIGCDGLLPYKKYETDAGIDFITPESFEIKPHGSYILDTKVGFKIPTGYFGLVTQRSSIGFNRNCILSLGIIDSSYIGNIKLKIFNLGDECESFQRGDRLAQMVIIPHETLTLRVIPTLLDTERGRTGLDQQEFESVYKAKRVYAKSHQGACRYEFPERPSGWYETLIYEIKEKCAMLNCCIIKPVIDVLHLITLIIVFIFIVCAFFIVATIAIPFLFIQWALPFILPGVFVFAVFFWFVFWIDFLIKLFI